MSVSAHDVRLVAALSRLALDEARIPALVEELNRILEHMDVLQQVDIAGVDPDGRHGEHAPYRPDVIDPVPFARPREHFAPAHREGFFLVPRLATHAEGDEGGA